jgi:hypothetical protein
MPNEASNVIVGQPRVEGVAYYAPAGTALPTDASTPLPPATWQMMGYASEDGLSNSQSMDNNEINAFGGVTVRTVMTGYSDEYSMTFIEAKNPLTLKAVFGDAQVTEDAGVTRVSKGAFERDYHPWVFDLADGDTLIRVVLPDAKISEVGDIVWNAQDAVGFECTIATRPNANGETSYYYMQAAI